MLEQILHIDQELFLFLNGLYSSFGDFFFYWITQTLIWVPLYLGVIYLIIKRWKKRAIAILALLIITVTLNDQSCNFIKRSVGRLRPSHDTEISEKVHLVKKPNGTYYRGGKYSFPSAHAANSIVLVWFFGFFVKTRRKWPLFAMILWSLSLAYSRIYLGVHYPLDILTGFAVGSFWSLLCIGGYKWISGQGNRGQGTGYKVQGTRYRVQGTRYKVQGTRYREQGAREVNK